MPSQSLFGYGLFNAISIFIVNRVSDLPVLLTYWDRKTVSLSHFHWPIDNYYPPGASILLLPFLWSRPNYIPAMYFYFVVSSILYFQICRALIKNHRIRLIALCAFTFNPYLLWLCNSGQDTVFELFLLLAFASMLIAGFKITMYLPLYLLCLVRPAYWATFFLLPLVMYFLEARRSLFPNKRFVLIPVFALISTVTLNLVAFGTPNLATSSGGTAFFSHNKYYYLSMPKFDMDVFLSKGGNMIPERILGSAELFSGVKDKDLRAALVSIIENPKSLALNSLQKIDSYFFAAQKTPQLPGSYFLSENQKSIVIENERLSWVLIVGNVSYFIYRSLLLISGIAAMTLFVTYFRRNRIGLANSVGYFSLPYLAGAIPGIIYYTESRFKVVSELLLVPLVLAIFEGYQKTSQSKLLQ